MTRDDGVTWEDVTPGDLPVDGTVNTIDVSTHRPGKVTVAVHRYRMDDCTPYIFQTTDGGDTWHRFDNGVSPASTTFGIAINEVDPSQVYFCTRKGQVFGTHDGGASWKEHVLPDMAVNVKAVACISV